MPNDSPRVVTYSTSIDPIVVSVNVFEIFDIKAIFHRSNGEYWLQFHFRFGGHASFGFPPKKQWVTTSAGTLYLGGKFGEDRFVWQTQSLTDWLTDYTVSKLYELWPTYLLKLDRHCYPCTLRKFCIDSNSISLPGFAHGGQQTELSQALRHVGNWTKSMLETRKVDTQCAFRKPTSIIRSRYALEECFESGCVVLFIVKRFLSKQTGKMFMWRHVRVSHLLISSCWDVVFTRFSDYCLLWP